MKKILGTIFIILYSIIALAVTILLLSYNEYMCSEINGYTLYIVRDDTLEPDFIKGDLLLIKKADRDRIKVGDKLFLYQNISSSEYKVKYGTLTAKSGYAQRTVYDIDNEYQFDSSYLMGTDDDLLVYHNLGTVLSILTSRWGYLFCIVVVTLLLFLEELYELFMEIKYGNEMDDEELPPEPKKVKKAQVTAEKETPAKAKTATAAKAKTATAAKAKTTTKANSTTTKTKKVKEEVEVAVEEVEEVEEESEQDS